ncbi:futalosine hydrolase [Streptomyces hainanensis]|uniref:Futalosine hydrolase n=1 Tax=Streptomyces hainanensis TaxID=402648 RepID=A0A4R4TJK6_9ACTN|nr:futalosine hydrolase [Streptomyces hainanensis]TDC75462.1 futalosine hydrolase [Streptomyces hainanensis]
MRLLIATAVDSERRAVTSAADGDPTVIRLATGVELHRVPLPGAPGELDAVAAGVGGPAAAAVVASVLAAGEGPYDLVVSAGIGGGFAERVPVGGLVVASTVLAADLGAQTRAGFADMAELGFGIVAHQPPEELATAVATATGAVHAPVLSVSTVTGTEERLAELAARHRGAAGEAMEGFGVACAAALHGVPMLEIRAVSNAVGPRDREAWRIPEALAALTAAFAAVGPAVHDWHTRERHREAPQTSQTPQSPEKETP